MRVLAIDVGTSSSKAAVLDVERAVPVGQIARVGYELDHPTPEAAEISVERLWTSIASAARAAARPIEGVEAVGFSCLTPALVLLDGADRPLGPIWTHLDRRSRAAARQVWADVGEEFLATTGNRPLPGGISAISWRQQVDLDPYLSRKTRCYLHVNGWLSLHTTGEKVFDPANASFTGIYGTLTDQSWSGRWCSYFGVEPEWLPRVVSGSTTIGTLRPGIAAELGVPAGVPVKLGTADTSSAVLAAGMVPGDLLHMVGTTQVVAALAPRPQPSPLRLTRLLGVGKEYIHVAHNPVGGGALEWMHGLCFQDQGAAKFYNETVKLALEHPTRVTLDPPYLGGDRLEIEAHRAAFRDLTLSTDRLELLAAVLQAMKRRHYEALNSLGLGSHFDRVFLAGGGADVVRQLIPEYAHGQTYPLEEGSLRGVACLFRQSIP
jgi:xylulokinase